MPRARLLLPLVLVFLMPVAVSQEPEEREFLQDTARRALIMWLGLTDRDLPVPPHVLGRDRIGEPFVLVDGGTGAVRPLEPPDRERMAPETGPLPPEIVPIYEQSRTEVILAGRMAFASCEHDEGEVKLVALCVFARPEDDWRLVTLSVGPLPREPE